MGFPILLHLTVSIAAAGRAIERMGDRKDVEMPIGVDDDEWIRTTITRRKEYYGTTSYWNYWPWRWCQVISILGSVTSAVVATAITESHPWLKWIAVIASAVATVASTLISTLKFREFYNIRELGLIFARSLENRARTFFLFPHTDEERMKFMDEITRELERLERDQLDLAKGAEGPHSTPKPSK